MGKYSELGMVEMWQLILEKLDELIDPGKPGVTVKSVASEPQYITPTDEHAKSRPMVEVYYSNEWVHRTLVAVVPRAKFQFKVIDEHGNLDGHKQCRMKVED